MRRLAALFLVGAFALMVSSVVHDATAGQHCIEEAAHQIAQCDCVCHAAKVNADQKSAPHSFGEISAPFFTEQVAFVADALGSGIFRPPQHLV